MAACPAQASPRGGPALIQRLPAAPLPLTVLELQHASFTEEARDRLKMQESLAEAAFRSLVLVNGGAIIALFTLIGSNAEVAKQVPGPSLWFALAAFGAGLAATILSNIAGFVMQIHYATMTERQMWNKELELAGQAPVHDVATCLSAGDRWEKIALGSVVCGLVFFIAGSALCFISFVS